MDPKLTNAALNLKRRAKKFSKARGPTLPALWLVTDEMRLPDPAAALASLPRGAGLILRHYDAPHRAALAKRLSTICRRRGIAFLIAGDWRLAAAVDATGLHLAEHAARRGPPPGARLWLQRSKLLTVAAHGAAGLHRAKALRASAAMLAPVFATASHPDRGCLGAMRATALIRRAGVPVVALGGITATTINRLQNSACAGVAGISFALS